MSCKQTKKNQKYTMKPTQKGFTLIELLVVIAIIAILAVIVVFAINPAELMRKSRDSVRIQEITALRKSIDATIATKTGSVLISANCPYNNPCNSAGGGQSSNGTGWLPVDIQQYSPTLPIDPLNNKPNVITADGTPAVAKYYFATDGEYYTVASFLESYQNITLQTNDGGLENRLYELGTGVSNPITIN